jgi:hypothetical protein
MVSSCKGLGIPKHDLFPFPSPRRMECCHTAWFLDTKQMLLYIFLRNTPTSTQEECTWNKTSSSWQVWELWTVPWTAFSKLMISIPYTGSVTRGILRNIQGESNYRPTKGLFIALMRQGSELGHNHFNSFNSQTKLNTGSQAAPFPERTASFHTSHLMLPTLTQLTGGIWVCCETWSTIFCRTHSISPSPTPWPMQT